MVAIASQKVERLNRVANESGVIAAAAMDQRGSLKKAIAQCKGIGKDAVTDDMMHEFKTAVSKVLTPHASAILLDPQWGIPAMRTRSDNAGLLVSYEESGYDQTGPGRMPALLPGWDVPKIIELGGDAIKILMYYTPFEKTDVNEKKHAWIRKIGEECDLNDIPFFLEDGQTIGRLAFERLTEPPESEYGEGVSSNYQGQGLKLSKHFKTG